MTQRNEFTYKNIELYKSASLGRGSYGGVCKAKCDGLLCAAKIMHPELFDRRDPGTDSYLHNFWEECHLLSLARHPNIVQYLTTYCDPDTQLPVLLMELCDECLTKFLERSPVPLSYHIQLNICHDIALGLTYLHSNGVNHRDLTGNNVLMIAGPRAKITDFGMSKLATVNPRMSALTQCPGNILYMPPEALDASVFYSHKLDIFSFGVIAIQILTRQLPNPTDRFRTVHVPQFEEPLKQDVPETERREAHLKLIPDTHSLKPVALQCLKKKEVQRPSALELSERLSELKQSSQYTEGLHQTQSSNSDIQQLQQQHQGQRIPTEGREWHIQIVELQTMVETKDRQLRENQHAAEMKDRELQQTREELRASEQLVSEFQQSLQGVVETKERELQQKQEQLQTYELIVSECQQSLTEKDKIISDLQQNLSAHGIKGHYTASGGLLPQQQPVTTPHAIAVQKDISKMTWREGVSAPEKMARGAVVVHGNTAYFRPDGSYKVYSYQNIHGAEQWSRLPDNTNGNFGLAVIDGLLTSVGGYYNSSSIKTLLSLTGEGERQQWSEVFPPMPTPRSATACVTTEQGLDLVVAGGYAGGLLDTVEVMNINTKQWTTASSLPQKCSVLSTAVCGDTLYLAGGLAGFTLSKAVFTCSISDLVKSSNTLGSRIRRTFSSRLDIWKEICSLPLTQSTLASFCGDLLAIGGRNDRGNSVTDVYRFDCRTNSWNVVNQMKNRRSWCFALSLPEDCLTIAGGHTGSYHFDETNIVEILNR